MLSRNIGSLDPASASMLNAAIQSGTWSADLKSTLASAVGDAACAPASAQQRRATQTLTDVLSYCTETDWATFNNRELAVEQKMLRLTDRLSMVGLRSPTEASTRASVAVIAATHYQEIPDANTLHSLVMMFKNALQARKVPDATAMQYIVKHPKKPTHLPEQIYAAAYQSGPPVSRMIQGYFEMMSRIPLRSTHKSLSRGSSSSSLSVEGILQAFINNNNIPGLVINPQVAPLSSAQHGGMSARAASALAARALEGISARAQPHHQPAPLAIEDCPRPAAPAAPGSSGGSVSVVAVPSSSGGNVLALAARPSSDGNGLAPESPHEIPAAQPSSERGVLAQGAPEAPEAPGSAAVGAAAQDEITRLEAIAAGTGNPPGVLRRPAASEAVLQSAAVLRRPAASESMLQSAAVLRRPAASEAMLQSAASGGTKRKLGCTKCRYSRGGCAQCQNPAYRPRRAG